MKAKTILMIFASLLLSCIKIKEEPKDNGFPNMEDLDTRYASNWNQPAYASANSGASVTYLSANEKKVLYYLNLVRLNPTLFASTYASGYNGANGYANLSDFDSAKASLISDLNATAATNALISDPTLYTYARCHADGLAAKGVLTHDRSVTGCPTGNFGENAGEGNLTPLDIIMAYLIDAGVSGYGHRKNCLNTQYHTTAPAIAADVGHGGRNVIDFAF